MTDTSTNSGGNTVGLLGVAFIVLKLCHVIDWPWIWVLAPFWVGLVICIPLLIVWLVLRRRVPRRFR